MSVRAYDPTLGRFISRGPLGRAPLMGWMTQPYAYAGNNPLLNVDPSGQRFAAEAGADPRTMLHIQQRAVARIYNVHHSHRWWSDQAKGAAARAAFTFGAIAFIARSLISGLTALATWLTETAIPWVLGLALDAGTTGIGFFVAVGFLAIAAALGALVLVLESFVQQLGIVAWEAAALGICFGWAANKPDLSYHDVAFWLKGAVVATLVASTGMQFFKALSAGTKAISDLLGGAFKALSSVLTVPQAFMTLVASNDVYLGATLFGTAAAAGGLGSMAFEYLDQMEGYVSQ